MGDRTKMKAFIVSALLGLAAAAPTPDASSYVISHAHGAVVSHGSHAAHHAVAHPVAHHAVVAHPVAHHAVAHPVVAHPVAHHAVAHHAVAHPVAHHAIAHPVVAHPVAHHA